MFYEIYFDKQDENGKYAEFSFEKGSIIFPNLEEYLEKLKNGQLTLEEKKELYNYVISNIENGTEEIADYIYGLILREYDKHYTSEDYIFISLYTIYLEYKKKKYDENGKIREGYEKLTLPSLKIYNKESSDLSGWYEHDSKAISVAHEDVFKKSKTLLDFIQTICHEMKHYMQEYEFKNGILNESSYAFILRANTYGRNYWLSTKELDAEEYATKRIIEIIEEYISTPILEELKLEENPDKELIEKMTSVFDEIIGSYKRELASLRRDKKIAFAFDDSELQLTDVSEILFLLKESNYIFEKGNNHLFTKFFGWLYRSRVFSKLLSFTPEKKVTLQSEEHLLKSYFSASPEEKAIYEKALKFIYTYDSEEESEYTSKESYYSISKLKIRFIEEQIKKEEEYLRTVKEILSDPLYKWDSRIVFTKVAVKKTLQDIINIRLKRLRYYILFTEKNNTLLHDEAVGLYDEFSKTYQEASSKLESSEMLNDLYKAKPSDIDFSNKISK